MYYKFLLLHFHFEIYFSVIHFFLNIINICVLLFLDLNIFIFVYLYFDIHLFTCI